MSIDAHRTLGKSLCAASNGKDKMRYRQLGLYDR